MKKKRSNLEHYFILIFASGATTYLLYNLMRLSGYLLLKTHNEVWSAFIKWTSSIYLLSHCALIVLSASIISLIICKLFMKKIKLNVFIVLSILAGPILALMMNNAGQR